jgi:hypothetical protein
MINKKFKKGEKAIAISNSTMCSNDELVVVSVGKKYITCQPYEYSYGRKYKFDINTLLREDWSIYKLYHSIEEYEEEKQFLEKIQKFKNDLLYGKITNEELVKFCQIHEEYLQTGKL